MDAFLRRYLVMQNASLAVMFVDPAAQQMVAQVVVAGATRTMMMSVANIISVTVELSRGKQTHDKGLTRWRGRRAVYHTCRRLLGPLRAEQLMEA